MDIGDRVRVTQNTREWQHHRKEGVITKITSLNGRTRTLQSDDSIQVAPNDLVLYTVEFADGQTFDEEERGLEVVSTG